MKIICDSCGTKYSISDDKVRGKVFKIRCKKCSHIIVVRGNEAAAEAAAPAVEGGWHIVVDGEQVGPLPEADVRARIERGELKADTYTWREGFADWLKLSAVPEFSDLVGGDSAPVTADPFAAAAAAPANGADRARKPSGARASLFGGAAAAASSDVFAAPAASAPRGGGDLFAAASAAAVPAETRWPASGPVASGHDGGRVENLTGQRHENSVLFSLANLQSLAMTSPSKASAVPASMGAPAPEGSGLIDIRAMAASTLGGPAEAGGLGGGRSSDDLPAFGSFSPAAPVLLPLQSGGAPKWIYPVVILMVGLVAVTIFFAYKLLTAKSPLEPVQVVVQAPAPPPAAEPARPAAKEEGKPSTIPDDKLPPRGDGAEAKGEGKSEKSEKSEHHHGKGSSKEKKVASADDSKKGGDSAPDTGEKKPAKGSIDDLLLGAVPQKKTAKASADDDPSNRKAAEGAGPLAKNAVVAGMNAVKPKINDCYNQFKVPGMAMVNVVILKSGKVGSATVTGKFAGTPTGSCVEKAVKGASFPPSDGLTTPYPFNLK
jgi:predicted Zn finger-like uncharacterized protein